MERDELWQSLCPGKRAQKPHCWAPKPGFESSRAAFSVFALPYQPVDAAQGGVPDQVKDVAQQVPQGYPDNQGDAPAKAETTTCAKRS